MTSIEVVRATLTETFALLDELCALPPERLATRPDRPDAWNIAEHLEHVSLTNHFLLLTATKGAAKAVRRAAEGAVPPPGESDLSLLDAIADPDAFEWLPPRHMIPTGTESIDTVATRLRLQHRECLALLAQIPRGEGRLCTLRMSVHSLGKIDLYQWLYFLAQHARYHIELISRLETPSPPRPSRPSVS